ncbi:MAG: excinuclease ABC subunit A [Patiriisocius sp.]|jgi:excinuclease ABC subunit A
MSRETIEVTGARVHNLKNIDVSIPRDSLVVITGLSGSGKSSLAFDTIYAEGQRRYIETFSAYARQFMGNMDRPDVDKITGLSPVISIEQKTISRNPRSTVGTITEIYNFIRLLFARASTAISYNTGEKMVKYSERQIADIILSKYKGKKIIILAPVVRGRKGHYRELFDRILKMGFLKARVDGKIVDLTDNYKLDRYKIHDVEIVIDKIALSQKEDQRLLKSIAAGMHHGKGSIMILEDVTQEVKFFSKALVCPSTGISYSDPEPNLFSFNSPYGSCPKCNGLGIIAQPDKAKVIPNGKKSIRQGGLAPLGAYRDNWMHRQIEAILKKSGQNLRTPLQEVPEETLDKILFGTDEALKIENNSGINQMSLNFEGVVTFVERQAEESNSAGIKKWALSFMNKVPCSTCGGSRLKKQSLYFLLDGKNIQELVDMDISSLFEWMSTIKDKLSERELKIARDPLKEIVNRLSFLVDVGLDYLTLDRSSTSLSGGEAQRIRLATQIGSQLVGVLYILDEPSIGLHQRDNHRLISSLKKLRDSGNSIIVVEHDRDIMMESDYIIDIGPGAGKLGGEIVGQGTPAELIGSESVTYGYLRNENKIEIPKKRRKGNGKKLKLSDCSGHNLKNVTLEIPLGKFVCVTGVSGSGKSSLINQTLYPILNNHIYKAHRSILPYQKITGIDHLDKVIEINQTPIGRTPRSNPATYTGLFDHIRDLFAKVPEAQIRGYKKGRFSFNTKGGRCETCRGGGMRTIEMNFLPDVYVECDTCNGKRYNRETLEIRFKGKSISDILDMTINDVYPMFQDHPRISNHLKTIIDVGLGYLSLGQSSTTLSGGEAQRIKLASELFKKSTGSTIYILDEPTTGLHFDDIKQLISVLNKLVDKGNTLVVIEHNMDIIKVADHVIDLGPEGGEKGGYIIANGTPESIMKNKKSLTGKYLKMELN